MKLRKEILWIQTMSILLKGWTCVTSCPWQKGRVHIASYKEFLIPYLPAYMSNAPFLTNKCVGWKPYSTTFACQNIKIIIMNKTKIVSSKIGAANFFATDISPMQKGSILKVSSLKVKWSLTKYYLVLFEICFIWLQTFESVISRFCEFDRH